MITSMLLPLGAMLLSQVPRVSSQSAVQATDSPIRKVVTLIEEMKVQVEKEGDEDRIAYDKYKCWCETNKGEKTEATRIAQKQIEDLSAFLEEAVATKGELKTEISGLEADIADDNDALATASSARIKEKQSFKAEEVDMKETRELLRQAIQVLSKVQLVQRSKGPVNNTEVKTARAMLLQLQDILPSRHPEYRDVMQRDLFDILGSFQEASRSFLHRRDITALGQTADDDLPWEKSEEQVGAEAKPNELDGAAAGSKSYNSRSGGIVGILSSMHDEFTRDLGAAQRADLEAEIAFQKLRATKLAEVEAAMKQKKAKESQLADLVDKEAKAKEDLEATEAALSADQKFLLELEKSCETEDNEYNARVKVRSEEIRALGETLKILTSDESRDMFAKTISLVQIDSVTHERTATEERAKRQVMQKIVKVARKHQNWALLGLAVRVRLDAFTKVKKAMDKMLAQLRKEQKDEVEKKDLCNKNIDKAEDDIKEANHLKNDLSEQQSGLSATLEELKDATSKLKSEIVDMQVSLKQAGENRKAENQIFQQSVSDQRATVAILNKALARLKSFYASKPSLAQVRAHGQQPVPGAAAPPPPPKPQAYSKSGGAGGVLQLIMKIISDAEREASALVQGEQHAQEEYASLAQDMSDSIEADRQAITEREKQIAEAQVAQSETELAQRTNDEKLAELSELLKAHHVDCDFVLKYFDVRQQARAEEMDSITEAKQILSGADFGSA